MKKIGISVHPTGRKLEFDGIKSIKTRWSPALRACDYKCPHCVWEVEYERDIRSEQKQG